jgi:hypothetical protein
LPTAIFLNIVVDRATPVNAPSGDNNNESHKLPSVKCNRCLIAGIAPTNVPNTKLETQNKNPTANAGFSLMKERVFFNNCE